MRARQRILGAVFAALFLGSCSSTSVPKLTQEEVPQFEAAANFPHGTYRLEPGDILQIRYLYHPENDQKEIVRPDGKIRAQHAGEVPAAGFTTTELESILEEQSKAKLRDPEVGVSVVEFAKRNVYVAGEVGKPGPVEYRKGLTPLQAIIEAGGLRETALTTSIVLVRAAGTDGKYVSRSLDIEEVLHEGKREPITLAPHDVVFVPRTAIAEADIWVDQHFTQLFPFFKGAGGSMRLGGGEGQ